MNDQTIQRIAYTHAASLRVEDNVGTFLKVTTLVKVSMHNTGTGFNDGDLRVVTDKVDEFLTSARNENIHIPNRLQQLRSSFSIGWKKRGNVFVDASFPKNLLYKFVNVSVRVLSIATSLENR